MKLRSIIFPALLATATWLTACEKTFDYDPSEIPDDFVGLPAPAPGTGYQLHVPAFPVPPHFEREWFMRMPVGNTDTIYVSKFESKCRPGTHHLVAYGYEDENAPNQPQIGVMRDANRPDGVSNFRGTMFGTINYFTSQGAESLLELPAGMAIEIPGGATVDLNSHYFNKTEDNKFGEVYMNAYTVDRSTVTTKLKTLLVDNSPELWLPPGETTKIVHHETFPSALTIYAMSSHMHHRGRLFQAFVEGGPRDGELLLESEDYLHPPQIFFTTPLAVGNGIGVRTEITYENETSRAIKFGVTSEDEMGIVFCLYAPQ